MIKYIRGTYAMPFESGIVVETASGIGFAVHVPTGSPLYRSREGEKVMVYTLMIVKEMTSACTASTIKKVWSCFAC